MLGLRVLEAGRTVNPNRILVWGLGLRVWGLGLLFRVEGYCLGLRVTV